ncbi:MAG: hypothetical protein M1831_001592 [Alyxoria varia]|nr:MAG: hypothetical protein M1831_001592 [Alyxoria varia]
MEDAEPITDVEVGDQSTSTRFPDVEYHGSRHCLGVRGDTVLLMDDGTRIQISACILASISDPFAKMFFSPDFKEGHARLARETQQPIEVSLPEDSPRGMLVLCELLYYKRAPCDFNNLPREDALKVAIIADKYLLVRPFMRNLGNVLSQRSSRLTDLDKNELFEWLAVACLLKSPTLFRKVSGLIVRKYRLEDSRDLFSTSSPRRDFIPPNILLAIHQYALHLRSIMTLEVWQMLANYPASPEKPLLAALTAWTHEDGTIDQLLTATLQRRQRSAEADIGVEMSVNMGLQCASLVTKYMSKSTGLCFTCAESGVAAGSSDCASHSTKK